jgi:hypothetical protein
VYGRLRSGLVALGVSALGACGSGHRIEGGGDRFVALSRGVLVAQRRSRGAVPDARHQLLGARARRCGERVAGVAQVVEAQAVAADSLAHRVPLAVPVTAPQRRALRAGEHDRVGFRTDVAAHVVGELVDDERRQGDRAWPASVFGGPSTLVPQDSSRACSTTSTVPACRSMRCRVSAVSSPQRSEP